MKSCIFGVGLLALSIVVVGLPAQEKGKPRTKNESGAVSKVNAASLTLLQRGDTGERVTNFAIGPQTKIFLQTNEDVISKGEGGRERKTPKTTEGKPADLKVDQRVTVGYTEAGKADNVLILRPTPPRKKEGEK